MKKLVLATFISLFILMGCSTTSVKTNSVTIEVRCTPQYPRPISINSLIAETDYVAKEGVGILFTAAGFSKVISWEHEAERYGTDAVNLQRYMEDCIADHNIALENLEEPAEEKKYFWQ